MRKSFFGISLALVLALTLFPGFAPNVSADPPSQSDHANLKVAGGDTAVYCGVETKKGEPWILHVAASAGLVGTLTITFGDGDTQTFNVPADGSFSMTQALGGVPGSVGPSPGVDDVVRISVGGDTTNVMASAEVFKSNAKDPFKDDGEKDNFCVTIGPGQAPVELNVPNGNFPGGAVNNDGIPLS